MGVHPSYWGFDMTKQLVFAILIGVMLFATGCKKETPLVKTEGSGQSTAQSTSTDDSSTENPGDPGTENPDTPTSNVPGNPLGTTAKPDVNPSIDANGNMIKKEDGKAPPPGRVWCDSCGGHLPKEDAVTIDGKTYCMACAEEIKK